MLFNRRGFSSDPMGMIGRNISTQVGEVIISRWSRRLSSMIAYGLSANLSVKLSNCHLLDLSKVVIVVPRLTRLLNPRWQ